LVALTRGALAVGARLLAVNGTPPVGRHGPILSRGGAVAGSTPAVLGRAPQDVISPAVRRHTGTRLKLVIPRGAGLVASGGGAVARIAAGVTPGGRTGTPRDPLVALARIVLARDEHEVVQASVTTCLQVTVASSLVHRRGSSIFAGHRFVGIRRGLLAVRPRLLPIGKRLFTVGPLLILTQARDACSVALLHRHIYARRVLGALA
jgi:hypothetical protein